MNYTPEGATKVEQMCRLPIKDYIRPKVGAWAHRALHMQNVTRTTLSAFLQLRSRMICLDVRAPEEFASGHIPGAVSFPLFSDAERAEVGTAYKQQSPQAALELGLLYVGPKMIDFVRKAVAMSEGQPLLMYCWRGGQRSAAMAWLLAQAGLEVLVLEGGYKAWRQAIHATIAQPRPLLVLGGKTGSGKTDTLKALRKLGQEVLDLEALANHKGSAFGAIDQPVQPTNEHFINLLGDALLKLSPQAPVWVEDESRMIGNINIPTGFFAQMQAAPRFVIDVSLRRRISRLVQEYGRAQSSVLRDSFQRIGKKIGGQQVKDALAALDEGDLVTAASIALRYYDRAYEIDLNTKRAIDLQIIKSSQEEPAYFAEVLLQKLKTTL